MTSVHGLHCESATEIVTAALEKGTEEDWFCQSAESPIVCFRFHRNIRFNSDVCSNIMQANPSWSMPLKQFP
uniref:Uncharacterized protein n=1 Tax=Trichuris muris TaxID=70415 RepID=A0A5S6R083_TRIMR